MGKGFIILGLSILALLTGCDTYYPVDQSLYMPSTTAWLYFFSDLIFALIPAQIAKNKGRVFWKWYIYGFFLFFIALIHAIRIKQGEPIAASISDWRKCPHCAELIKKEATICKHCHSAVEPYVAPEPTSNITAPTAQAIGVWECKKCGAETPRNEWVCKSCGAAR